MTEGIQFPLSNDGRRSSTAASAAAISAAVSALDDGLARAILAERYWRKRYADYLLRLADLAVRTGEGAQSIARNGLAHVQERFQFLRDGEVMTPRESFTRFDKSYFHTATVRGLSPRASSLVVPYRGEQLSGDALRRQIDRWREAGVMEPSAAEALHEVIGNSDWLDLRGQRFVMLGAGAEMGPFEVLSQLGATVLAVDLDRPAVWQRLIAVTRAGAGELVFPVTGPVAEASSDADLAAIAGGDLLTQLPELQAWLVQQEGPLCVGGYAYLHGADHVRVAVAMDAMMEDLLQRRADVSLAFLLTPTGVFAIPGEAARAAREHYAAAGLRSLWRRPVEALTGGRWYAASGRREVSAGEAIRYFIYDGVVPAQGPNYALAKQLQKWRAVAARGAGVRVSANVAPATVTASVLSRRAFAAAYAGAGHYGVEIFEPATSNAVMAALLIHDLRHEQAVAHPATPLDHPFGLFMQGAVHGGMWRLGYQPRSVLEIAAVRGLLSGAGGQRAQVAGQALDPALVANGGAGSRSGKR